VCYCGHMAYTPTLVPDMTLATFSEALLAIKKSCHGREDCLAIQRALILEELDTASSPREWSRLAKIVLKSNKNRPPQRSQVVDPYQRDTTLPQDLYIGGVGVRPRQDELDQVGERLAKLTAHFGSYMLVSDHQALDIILAVVAGHYWKGVNPAWMLAIGPPGSGKTEYIDILQKMRPLVQPLSEVSEKTWVSGLDAKDAVGGVAPSLLDKYPNNIFVYKDLTTMLSKRIEGRVATFGQFTEIFDGHLNKKFGTGLEFDWEGYTTMLMGVTQLIYHQHAILNLLGPRFLLMRLKLGSAIKQSRFSLSIKHIQYKEAKAQMQLMVKEFFDLLPKWQPDLPAQYQDILAHMGTMIALARSSPDRDREGEIEATYEAEMPARVSQQLARLAMALALIHGRYEVGPEEMVLVKRIAFDTILPVRSHIIYKLYQEKELGVGQLRNGSTFGDTFIQHSLQDMAAFGVVQPIGDHTTDASPWQLGTEFRSTLDAIGGPLLA
jgi:hypothetical protein